MRKVHGLGYKFDRAIRPRNNQVFNSRAANTNFIDIKMSNKRVEHLIETRAFTRQTLPGGMPKGSSLEAEVKRLLQEWEEERKGFLRVKSRMLYKTLHDRSSQPKGFLALITEHPQAVQSFSVYPSNLGPLEIRDQQGVILGYRFRIPNQLIETLNESTTHLPTAKRAQVGGGNPNIRGNYQCRHYAVWADYASKYRESGELERDGDDGRAWLDANQELFNFCSHQLRLVSPEQYVRMTGAVAKDMRRFKGKTGMRFNPLAGAWHGVAINQGMQEDESESHQDVMDNKGLFNCVVPFGDGFGGGDLVLWEMKMRIGLQVGDGFFFFGSMVAHKVAPITDGIRNSLDLFTHASNFHVLERHQEQANKKKYPQKKYKVRREADNEKAKKVPENIKARRLIMEGKKARQRA